jgi:DNA-directed RNA polymerase specialized sigma24 family protein
LTLLCETYWTPLYWFARRQSHRPDEAQDLTQAFLTEFIEKARVRAANPERGRFRSFLLASFKHFILNDAQARRAENEAAVRRCCRSSSTPPRAAIRSNRPTRARPMRSSIVNGR